MTAVAPHKNEDHHLGHRERLRDRFLKNGAEALPDYELLEMVLFMAMPRGDTKPLAKELIGRFGSFAQTIAAAPHELKKVKGMGDSGVAALKVIEAAAVRLKHGQVKNQPVISSWMAILDYVESRLKYKEVEEFHVLFLDRKNKLLADELQQQGTVDQAPVYPREVMKRALELNASALILVHNHPSGDPEPSPMDIEVTRQIQCAAEAVGIKVHDHVIVGRTTHKSFKSMGLL